MMTRFWFEFVNPPTGTALSIGCGITAHSLDDAKNILMEKVFVDMDVPIFRCIVTDPNISEIDAAHVRPNMGNVFARGVWFPLGFD